MSEQTKVRLDIIGETLGPDEKFRIDVFSR